MDLSCVWCWVQAYAPEINQRCRPHLKYTNKSYRVDETYSKVKGQEKYLYRAVESTGQSIDFLLTAYPAAIKGLQREDTLPRRGVCGNLST